MLDEAAAFFEEFVGFAGEADYYVSRDGTVRYDLTDFSDIFCVVPRTILAMHLAQNAVTAGLQWNMRVLGDSRRVGDQGDQVVAPVHGLDRADANFFDAGVFEKRTHKLLKPLLRRGVA